MRVSLALISFLLWPLGLSAADIITFSSGTITLHGVIYKPEGTGPFPAVVYNHGTLDVNQNVYTRVAFDRQEEAVNRLDSALRVS